MYQGNDCMSQISGLLDCYGQVQAATAFITKVISSKPIPLLGVTDGSNAQPGQVGEFVPLNLGGTYPTGNSTQLLTLGTLQPGDWDLDGALGIGGSIQSVYTGLTPQPAGFSWNMGGYQAVAAAPGTSSEFVIIPLVPTRASISVATFVSFTLTIAAGANPGANFQYVIRARRMR